MLELRRRTLGVRRVSRRDRRGVLLMVVLSMLALFLLLGTAFLVSSQFYATSGKEAAKMGRTTNNSGDLLERAMLQVLRDTNNPNSAIRYHSLLRDVYGSDGFVGRVFFPPDASPDAHAAVCRRVYSWHLSSDQLRDSLVEFYMMDDGRWHTDACRRPRTSLSLNAHAGRVPLGP